MKVVEEGMTIQEWLTKTYYPSKSGIIRSNKVRCKDGFEISVQASIWHYCIPRATLHNGERYKKVELGYANEREELLEEYREGMVYPYVPVDIVNKVLEKHGGIEFEKGNVITADGWKDVTREKAITELKESEE